MKKDGIKKNIGYQFIYQFLILVVPLIISPYLTRTLGDTALGTFSFANSIAYYFCIACMLGIVKHGQRVIAAKRDDSISLRKAFWSLFLLHIIVSIVVLISYGVYCIFFVKEDGLIYYVQIFYVFSAMFDITWLFYGLEKFKTVVFRNAIVKLIELICIFSLVKSRDDFIAYVVIMSISPLASNISLVPIAIRKIRPIQISWIDCKEHIKPILILTISVVAVSMYTVFDKTLLGIMASKEDVAYYEYSNKIINIPKTFITVIGTVLFPRACNSVALKKYDESRKYYGYSLLAIYFIGFASLFGLLGIADLFATIYYGKEFAVCGGIIKALAPIILVIGLGDIFRMQFLIPMHKDIQYTICIVINAVMNIILSGLLIPVCGMYGAVIGTLSAEVFGTVYQAYLCRAFIDKRKTIHLMLPFLFSGIIMLCVIEMIKTWNNSNLGDLVLQVFAGGIVYLIVLGIYFIFISKDRDKFCELLKIILQKKRSKN